MTHHEPTDGRLRFDHVPPDAPEALALMHALVSDLLARYGADDWQGDVVPEGCTAPSGAFVVVRAEGRPVACGGLRALAPGVAELKRMYVSPAVRGRGVARALLAHLEEEARARGYRTMRLEAGTRQPEALRLYEAAGYRPVTPGWGEYADDPQSVFLEKPLWHASAPESAEGGAVRTTVRVNDVELHYRARGEGETIVFVHGALEDEREWEDVAQQLRGSYRTITYSRRYNHPNANRVTDRNHSAIVESDDLAQLIRELAGGPVHVAGVSYGAYTALLAAVRYPQLVRTLVIVEPALIPWAQGLPGGRTLHADFMNMWLAAGRAFERGDTNAALRAATDWFISPGAFAALPTSARAAIEDNVEEWRALTTSRDAFPGLSPEAVQAIEAPTLMISGGSSYPILRLIDDEVQRHLRHGRRLIVPDGRHDVCSTHAPTCARAMLEFLADV